MAEIKRINKNNSIDNKIALLNEMIITINGLIAQARFDVNELDDLYQQLSQINLERKFLRNVPVGNTPATYNNWSHVYNELGYSIWKITPTHYAYNENNNLYFNDVVLQNRGLASSETSTIFSRVFLYDPNESALYFDNSTEAGTENGTSFETLLDTDGYLYVGDDAQFNGIKFEWDTRGSGYDLVAEYWNGSNWIELDFETNGLQDDTSNFQSDGRISWDTISNWAQSTVNSANKYWIRISTTTTPITVATSFLIIPGDSVIGLLSMSSSDLLAENWAWCSYGNTIYVTIKNNANSSYEGITFLTATSSASNKQNFFVFNNQYLLDHEDNTYVANDITVGGEGSNLSVRTSSSANEALNDSDDVLLANAVGNDIIVDIPTASGRSGKKFIIKKIDTSANTVTLVAESNENIDNVSSVTMGVFNQALTIVSNGTYWYIIA